ncbi:hypothetical protein B9479_004695 [Cryptococcus floricola]|uniref:Maintenance of mitochondrial morphology protein 1 n=1 Tax=Cryptococcus floricola TaxID=2591691 RepID=A0A5D3AWM2_9TREE|nr:hypothetical protein B9479_004695 [Cryptococcus floricola]
MDPLSNWTFTQGFIFGQASFLLILLLFVRYIVFSPSDQVDHDAWRKRRLERHASSAAAIKASTSSHTPPPPASLLSKTKYDMSVHAPESADWLNVLLGQVVQGYRNDLLSDGGEEGARLRVERWLNPKGKQLSWLDPIEVTKISLGSSFPLLSNARIRPADGHGRLRAEVDVDYLDSMSMSLSTAVLINFPRPRFAVLPVSLGVELVSIGGTMSVQLHDPTGDQQHLHTSLLPDFHLHLKTTSLLGSRAKLQDIPKLEQLIVSRLRSLVQDKYVSPNYISVGLPKVLAGSGSNEEEQGVDGDEGAGQLLEDLGEGAVGAMKEAVGEGMKRMVEDFMPSTSPLLELREENLVQEPEQYGTTTSAFGPGTPLIQPPGTFPHTPGTHQLRQGGNPFFPAIPQTPTGSGRRPQLHPSQSQSQSHLNPPSALQSQFQGQQGLTSQSLYQASQFQRPERPGVVHRQSSGLSGAASSSLAPSQSQSQFRFRGHFASKG